jgi:hypothetical protein
VWYSMYLDEEEENNLSVSKRRDEHKHYLRIKHV